MRHNWAIGVLALLGCGQKPAPSSAAQSSSVAGTASDPVAAPSVTVAMAPPPVTSALPVAASSPVAPSSPAAACPDGMQHVRTSFCPKMERECVDKEYDEPNRITICHRFREGKNDCREPRVALDYCVDEFEYPNQRGAKPPVMVSFFDAERSCGERGKRLCRESEWVAACEGPEETPFPYGWRREPDKCNIDNRWVAPSLARVYSTDPDVQQAELLRLDRSAPSGEKSGCRSGFGVFDLTGNVDEWVRADVERKNRRSRVAALKGGAWGHVRNACRPVTTSHPPDFKYYFIGFRCCKDAAPP